MTRLDEIIANALAGIPETDAAILAREVVRLRGATSVVVPELTNSEKCKATREWFMQPEQRDYNKNDPVVNLAFMAGMDEGYSIAISRLRAIPADRVLGEGMVQVDRRIIEKFTSGCGEWMPGLGRCGDQYPGGKRQLCAKCMPLRDALRANQGGADHE